MIKRVSCIEVPVSDMGRAVTFYEETLGLSKEYEHPVWTSFDIGGTSIALAASGTKGRRGDAEVCKSCSPCVLRYASPGQPQDTATATVVVYLAVKELDAFCGQLREKGVEFVAGPREQGWGGRSAVMLDPDKNILVLAQYPRDDGATASAA